MHILLLIDQLQSGGAETHVVTLAQGLHRRGHTVTVCSGGGQYEHVLRAMGIPCLRFPIPPGRARPHELWRDVAFLQAWQKRSEAPAEILHAHTRRTALILRLFRLRHPHCLSASVVTAHAAFRPTYRGLSYWGNRTIAVSEDLKQHLIHAFGVSPDRVQVIPNGIDCTHFCPVGEVQATKKAADERHLVFASRLDRDCSAAAFAILSLCGTWQDALRGHNIRLRITLAGGGECLEELRHTIASLPPVCAEILRLPGNVCDMAALLRTADVFVGVSRAALEAVACGCRVVLAGNEGFGGVLDEQNFDHFAEGNFCCRREALLTRRGLDTAVRSLLLADPLASRSVAEHLRERVTRHYDAPRMAEDTERVYLAALGRAGAHG